MIRDIRSNGPVNTEQNYLIIVEIVEFPHFSYFFIFKKSPLSNMRGVRGAESAPVMSSYNH
jgi:hypothetical protein